jgi:hypothetical protein
MPIDDLAKKVIDVIQGKPEAVKAISDALVAGDASEIRDAVHKHAGIEITGDEAEAIAARIRANPSAVAAYVT